MPFNVAPLTRKPPTNKTIAEVNCTLPLCVYGTVKTAASALGWKYVGVPYDITAGPAAYAAAMKRALQLNPNYIVTVGVYPPATVAPELAQAKARGIAVMEVAGLQNNPAIVECSNCAAYFEKDGALQEDLAVAKYGVGVKIADVGDPSNEDTGTVNKGMFAEAKRLGAAPPQTVSISSQSPAANSAVVISYLQRNPDTQVILDSFPDQVTGLPQALARVGLSQKVIYINSGPSLADINDIKAGSLAATMGLEDHAAWWRSVDAAARLAAGDPVNPDPSTWQQIVTKQNLASVLAAGGANVPEPPHYQQAYLKAWKVG